MHIALTDVNIACFIHDFLSVWLVNQNHLIPQSFWPSVHAQSCPTLCDPMDCSPPGSSVHGIFQARILEWVAMPFSRGLSQHRDQTRVSRIARQILYHLSYLGSPLVQENNPLKYFFPLNLNLILLMNNVLEITFSV